MKISRILHAGYIFESDSTQIIFDPIFENPFSRNCYAYPNVQFDYAQIKKLKPDAVFISHYHDDHCSLESLQYLDRETTIYLYCIHDELFWILRELGFLNVQSLQTDVLVKVGAFEIIPRLALDTDVDSIFHIKAEGLNILNVVDAWIDPSAMVKLKQNSWDIILWPFQTMREIEVIAPSLALPAELPTEWIEQLKALNPRFIVPSSCQFTQEEWSWYRKAYFPISYKIFKMEVEAALPNSKIHRLNPGISIELNKSHLKQSPPLAWIIPIGEQDVDYEYDPHLKLPATADIAKNFTALSTEKRQRVFNYCKIELLEKYNSMNTELSGQWKLALYDHSGQAINFYYELQAGTIKLANENFSITWITEVPLAKIYSAIAEGESLSSLYLRMQGMPFENIEEDPLIACLFHGEFASYQRNQLQKILVNSSNKLADHRENSITN